MDSIDPTAHKPREGLALRVDICSDTDMVKFLVPKLKIYIESISFTVVCSSRYSRYTYKLQPTVGISPLQDTHNRTSPYS